MMVPLLTTEPALPSRKNTYRPALKSESLIESEVARIAPTSTLAPGANSTPLVLTRNTCPLEVRRPKISDGLMPRTRLSAIADELGWLKLTQAPEPIENVCQLRIALLVLWSTCSLLPVVVMVALPETTWPP